MRFPHLLWSTLALSFPVFASTPAAPIAATAEEIALLPRFLKLTRPLRVDAGELLKIKTDESQDATQCFVKNTRDRAARLPAQASVDVISVTGSQKRDKFWDWEYRLPSQGLTIRCEFPQGTSRESVHRDALSALGSHFALGPAPALAARSAAGAESASAPAPSRR